MGGVLSLGLWILASSAFAADLNTKQFEGKRITTISFSGAQPLAPQDLAKAQPLKVGEPLRAKDVSDAIDGLFATGYFSDVAVEAEPSGNGVSIRFVTRNVRFVGGVSVEGKVTDAPNRGQLFEAANLSLGAPFCEDDVKQAVSNLQHLLQTNGLYEAEVKPETMPAGAAEQVFITLQVSTGKRAKYEMPVVQGQANLSDDALVRLTGSPGPVPPAFHTWRVCPSRPAA